MEMNIEHPTLKWKRVKSLNWEWGEESEVRGQRSEVRGQRSEVRGQRSEVIREDEEVASSRSVGILPTFF